MDELIEPPASSPSVPVGARHALPQRGRRGFALSGRFLTALAAAAVLALSFVWSPEALPKVSLCYFNHWTGLPCPGCGLTRGFCALSHGRLGEAWALNPFSLVFYLIAIALILWPLAARLTPGAERILYHRRALLLVPLVLGSMLVFGIVRLLRLVAA